MKPKTSNVGALIIRIGFWGIFLLQIIIQNPPKTVNIQNHDKAPFFVTIFCHMTGLGSRRSAVALLQEGKRSGHGLLAGQVFLGLGSAVSGVGFRVWALRCRAEGSRGRCVRHN